MKANLHVSLIISLFLIGCSDLAFKGEDKNSSNENTKKSKIKKIVGSNNAMAALYNNGAVLAWGDYFRGGNIEPVAKQLKAGVKDVVASDDGFVALKHNGSAIYWGKDFQKYDQSGQNLLPTLFNYNDLKPDLESGVKKVITDRSAFYVLKKSGKVVMWGPGVAMTDYCVREALSKDVIDIQSNASMPFAKKGAVWARKKDGSVVIWAGVSTRPNHLGDCHPPFNIPEAELRSGIKTIVSNHNSVILLKDDGSASYWGDMTGVTAQSVSSISSGVKEIVPGHSSFAVFKNDGSVVSLGNPNSGGDSQSVSHLLQSGVKKIVPTYNGFAALKNDGSVVTWGRAGSDFVNQVSYLYDDESATQSTATSVVDQLSSGVIDLVAGSYAVSAIKGDGSVVAWGDNNGAYMTPSVWDKLQSDVVRVVAGDFGFTALKKDGSAVFWGTPESVNGYPDAEKLEAGILDIYVSDSAYAVVKGKDEIITWGVPEKGGDINYGDFLLNVECSGSDGLGNQLKVFTTILSSDRAGALEIQVNNDLIEVSPNELEQTSILHVLDSDSDELKTFSMMSFEVEPGLKINNSDFHLTRALEFTHQGTFYQATGEVICRKIDN